MRYRFLYSRSGRGLTAPIGVNRGEVYLCSYADRETERAAAGPECGRLTLFPYGKGVF